VTEDRLNEMTEEIGLPNGLCQSILIKEFGVKEVLGKFVP
jgi:hypothetical protein